jgi:hypothetical protein
VITVHKRTARRFLAAMAAGAVLAGTGIAYAADVKADPGIGCQTDRWGFLGSSRRTICDTPRAADGSWTRLRIVWTPAHYVPVSCYSSRYYGSCSGGYHVDETLQARETYPVTDGNVLADEPGWLPTGTDVIR